MKVGIKLGRCLFQTKKTTAAINFHPKIGNFIFLNVYKISTPFTQECIQLCDTTCVQMSLSKTQLNRLASPGLGSYKNLCKNEKITMNVTNFMKQ